MKKGAWHQCGDKSQKLAVEMLKHGSGVGVVLSPKDLARHNAIGYAEQYRDLGASVLLDQQFYVPDFKNDLLETYDTHAFRNSITQLGKISTIQLDKLAMALEKDAKDLKVDALIAPAVVYEAQRSDIAQLNAVLFRQSKKVGDSLGLPTYATVIIGQSGITSQGVADNLLSAATSLDAAGYYYGIEFGAGPSIPVDYDMVKRCAATGLSLACTGRPVLHAFAGPMSLLSLGFGATGTGIGFRQNVWQFQRGRFAAPKSGGGGGDAPPRFFSSELWSTIIYPDEMVKIKPPLLQSQIWTSTPFKAPPTTSGGQWNKWDSHRHLLIAICAEIEKMAALATARESANHAIDTLTSAIALHQKIAKSTTLKENTSHHKVWRSVLADLLTERSNDYDFMDILS
jgi:hypothetical protein